MYNHFRKQFEWNKCLHCVTLASTIESKQMGQGSSRSSSSSFVALARKLSLTAAVRLAMKIVQASPAFTQMLQ